MKKINFLKDIPLLNSRLVFTLIISSLIFLKAFSRDVPDLGRNKEEIQTSQYGSELLKCWDRAVPGTNILVLSPAAAGYLYSFVKKYKTWKAGKNLAAELGDDAAKLEADMARVESELGIVKSGEKVWSNIVGTQPLYGPNSLIYKSFELRAGTSKVWVHGNATEHLRELEINILKDISKTPDAKRLSIELMLTDFQGAIKKATEEGIKYDKLIVVDRWEFKFSAPRETGQLPSLIHAQPK